MSLSPNAPPAELLARADFPSDVGTDPNKPPAVSCYVHNIGAAGNNTYLPVNATVLGQAQLLGPRCQVSFEGGVGSGHWVASISNMNPSFFGPTDWFATFVVVF